MARDRSDLQEILENLLGSANVYFQPPANLTMQYPCIVYGRNNADVDFAGNFPYRDCLRYQITVIDRNPDSDIPKKVAQLPMTLMQRAFAANNLNHDVFFTYF